MYASLRELQAAMMGSNYGRLNLHHRVTKSYRKGRTLRVQNIYDKNGFVVKQIIHKMY